jgi:16S rRNA (adenine1518-N6/adenine1519-N6)-dimethyltransferase
MVQLEVAERFFAAPSTKAYGAVSVLVQLSTRRTGFHRVSRHVFRPPPRVVSAHVAFERIEAPPALAAIARVVEGAFAHRRKTLPNSLALAGVAGREPAAAALHLIGRDTSVRAEALEPAEFVALEKALRTC